MPYNNQCQDCRSRGRNRPCSRHNTPGARASSYESSYEPDTSRPDSGMGFFTDSSGDVCYGNQATGTGVDLVTGDTVAGFVDTGSPDPGYTSDC